MPLHQCVKAFVFHVLKYSIINGIQYYKSIFKKLKAKKSYDPETQNHLMMKNYLFTISKNSS